ncbi:TIM barrel protein [Microbulbifer sp. JMSA008]|uniref:TIM barrel protein n=1 Tax=Microbulbifer sp. JMSA008 TaxID=3243373 RepID=UPI004039EA87
MISIKFGIAPCCWGVEFADDSRNPHWTHVLDQCESAGYTGIELGPVGYMPSDVLILGDALASRNLEIVGGVIFQPFHDPDAWSHVLDVSKRTCKILESHGAENLVLIDSISSRRVATVGRENEAETMSSREWKDFKERILTVARLGTEEHGLKVGIHAHVGGYIEFESELERLLAETDPYLLKICLDTGHSVYAGFNPVDFIRRHMSRISYLHFKDVSPVIKAYALASRMNFYDACAQGVFCHLGDGEVDFLGIYEQLISDGYSGWCTVEQDCDPQGNTSPIEDAIYNRRFLNSIGFNQEVLDG